MCLLIHYASSDNLERKAETMEEQLQSISSPKQDRMISLIAWLIIASLLFYLTVVTFEGFLRLTPEIQITQKVEATEDDIVTEFNEAPSAMIDTEELPADFSQDGINELANTDDINSEQIVDIPVVEDPVEEDIIANTVDFNSDLTEQDSEILENEVDSQVVKSTIDENVLVGSVNEELSELTPNLYQLRLSKSFVTRTEAFTYLKQIDYGELDISLELVQRGDTIHVFIGDLMPKSDVDRLEQYLAVRNNGLLMSVLGNQEREDLLKASRLVTPPKVVLPVSQSENTLPVAPVARVAQSVVAADQNFWGEVGLKPFTIQVGSFLKMTNARNLSNQLRAKSFSSDVETFSFRGVEQFRVLVGNFVTRSEATKFATQLSENEKLPVYVRLAVNR